MAIGSVALVNLLVVLAIGIIVGLAFTRYARSWLARLGSTTRSDITSALVGVAGSFIGFHIGVIIGLLPSPLMLYLAAVVGLLSRSGCGGDGSLREAQQLNSRTRTSHPRVLERAFRDAAVGRVPKSTA